MLESEVILGNFARRLVKGRRMFEICEDDVEIMNGIADRYERITDLEKILKYEEKTIVVYSTVDELKAKYSC